MEKNDIGEIQVRIPRIYLKTIEKIIGIAVDPSEQGKFSSFREVDELTKSRVKDIYMLSDELKARAYLVYLLPAGLDRGHVFSFLFDVIIDGMDQDQWERDKDVLSSPNRN